MVRKFIHVPFTWHPAACGGTEVYVRSLMRELALLGLENQVVVPADESGQEYLDGIKVHRVAMTTELTQEMLYGAGDPVSAEAFAQVLEDEKPDVLHFHAYSPAVSVLWLEAARLRGIPCVYTYHTPTLACGRGTLMRWGSEPCDGKMTTLRCSACTLHGLGVHQVMAWALALASPLTQGFSSRVPFRIWPLMERRHRAVRRWLDGMTRVVALCEWGREVMRRNAVADSKLRVVRHGLAGWGRGEDAETGRLRDGETRRRGPCFAEASQGKDSEALRVAFFGRLDRTKGLHVLAGALALMPELKLELHCHLIVGADLDAEMRTLLEELQGDPRIQVHPPVASDEVVRVMAVYDAVAVPSIWLETGPLVVLEAFAAGVPVLGSDLGGIAEWVEHEYNGLLIPPGDVPAWAAALLRFTRDPALRDRLSSGVRPPPTMREVARKMQDVYLEVVPT